ncbi:hypothetical protein COLO4_09251 [Corchorus olitorius]|uniref:Uncharacterized protein n=1 Tax=Corchorus olitorius TaxID=93759 RepID=A0A1R3KCN2_9ROSI|nr:hypothetical protein COLO4_28246 [Corchorus olitorius]OMP04843.1 hypothetical protein COLO4_09251 [Corchorus olitorius]
MFIPWVERSFFTVVSERLSRERVVKSVYMEREREWNGDGSVECQVFGVVCEVYWREKGGDQCALVFENGERECEGEGRLSMDDKVGELASERIVPSPPSV